MDPRRNEAQAGTLFEGAFALSFQKIQNSCFKLGKVAKGHRKKKNHKRLNGHIIHCQSVDLSLSSGIQVVIFFLG